MRPRSPLSPAARLEAWFATLIIAPLLFTAAVPLIGMAVNAHGDWERFVRLLESGSLLNDWNLLPLMAGYLAVFGALPALVLGVPAALVLERFDGTRLTYAAAGFVLGVLGSFIVLPILFHIRVVELSGVLLTGAYGALVAFIYRTITRGTDRALARRSSGDAPDAP